MTSPSSGERPVEPVYQEDGQHHGQEQNGLPDAFYHGWARSGGSPAQSGCSSNTRRRCADASPDPASTAAAQAASQALSRTADQASAAQALSRTAASSVSVASPSAWRRAVLMATCGM